MITLSKKAKIYSAIILTTLIAYSLIAKTTPLEIANLIASIATAYGLLFLANQLELQREADRKNTDMQQKTQMVELFEEFIPEFRTKLAFIYHHNPEDLTMAKLKDDERAMLDEVTAWLDSLGYRLKEGILPHDHTLTLFYPTILKCAQQLFPFHIPEERRRRIEGNVKDTLKRHYYFEWLAKETKLFYLENHTTFNKSKTLSKDMDINEMLEDEELEPLHIFKSYEEDDEGSNVR